MVLSIKSSSTRSSWQSIQAKTSIEYLKNCTDAKVETFVGEPSYDNMFTGMKLPNNPKFVDIFNIRYGLDKYWSIIGR